MHVIFVLSLMLLVSVFGLYWIRGGRLMVMLINGRFVLFVLVELLLVGLVFLFVFLLVVVGSGHVW